ncbi:MAG: hypothetical protein Q7T03_04115 [Deltaproteobacteria bacterium]|nr:hypothetical protein [Deltaproteobacteria bacterium]
MAKQKTKILGLLIAVMAVVGWKSAFAINNLPLDAHIDPIATNSQYRLIAPRLDLTIQNPCADIYASLSQTESCTSAEGDRCMTLPVSLTTDADRHCVLKTFIGTATEQIVGLFSGMTDRNLAVRVDDFHASTNGLMTLNHTIIDPAAFLTYHHFAYIDINPPHTLTRIHFSPIQYAGAPEASQDAHDLPLLLPASATNTLLNLANQNLLPFPLATNIRNITLADDVTDPIGEPWVPPGPVIGPVLLPPAHVDALENSNLANVGGGCSLQAGAVQEGLGFAFSWILFAGVGLAGIRRKIRR